MYHFFRGLRPLLWLIRLLTVLLAVYLIIVVVEAEDFLQNVHQNAHFVKFLFLASGYMLLALFTDWLIRFRRPRLSQLNADRQACLIYLKRSFLLPIIPFLLLPAAYILLWARPAATLSTAWHILCISLAMLALFSVVNQLSLALYFLAVNARARNLELLRRKKAAQQQTVPKALPDSNQQASDLARYLVFMLYKRKVIAYDENGHATVLKYNSLAKIKQLLNGDPRFFMTGSWILRYDALDRLESGDKSRGLKLYSKYIPSGFFELNKNNRREFMDWCKQFKHHWETAN